MKVKHPLRAVKVNWHLWKLDLLSSLIFMSQVSTFFSKMSYVNKNNIREEEQLKLL